MRHELKTDPIVFQAVLDGLKTYELRKNDRAFAVGDTLLLRETRYTGKEMISHEHPDRPGKIVEGKPLEYTGREVEKTISHILTGPVYGLANEWSILSFNQSDELEAARAEIENVHLDETKNQTSSGDYITPQDDNETSFGDGNFTLEGFIDDFRIKNKGWRSVTFARKLCNFFIHTTETVNGVDYIVVIELDDDGHLVKKEYTLASRVRG